jgi:hypothetical protein
MVSFFSLSVVCVCVLLGFEHRAYTLSPFFVKGFFEVGSHKLFA